MASRRKTRVNTNTGDAQQYAEFLRDGLAGTIAATRLVESRDANGKLLLQYDDPNG